MNSPPTSNLRIYMFGPFEVFHGDTPVDDKAWGRKKTKDLLKILLSQRGQTFTQDQLIDLLYPDADPDKVIKNLRGRVSELRKVLEPDLKKGPESKFILNIGQGYAFNANSGCWLDIKQFEQHLHTAQELYQTERWSQALEQYQQATHLYRGEFLMEDAYEDWAIEIREHYQGRLLDAVEKQAECHGHLGDYVKALACCEKLLNQSPQRESAYQLKMRFHYEAGERQQALETYDACLNNLKDHLGVEPSTATKTLYLQINKNQLEKQSTTAPDNLPILLTSFVGRQAELDALMQQIQAADCRALTVMGPGGMGKTTLAIKTATQCKDHFKDGVYWVPLAEVAAFEQVPLVLADALKFNFHGTASETEQLMDFLKNKQLLLVIDNVEHLLDGVAWFNTLLSQAPEVCCLFTSRAKLNLKGEQVFQLDGLNFPANGTVSDLKNYDAVQLFLGTAQRIDAQFALSEEQHNVARICQLVEGVPLGIELAATWVEVISCEEIVGEIERNLDFLASDMQDVPERHRSVRAVFEHSIALIPKAERDIFAKLSVFRGGFTREAAQQVAGASLKNLSSLMHKSFIKRLSSDRYHVHELMRQYGESKLTPAAQSRIREAHLQFYLQQAAQAAPHLMGGAKQEPWLNHLELERGNTQAAIEWALTHQPQSGLVLANDLARFWNIRSHYTEGRRALNRLLEKNATAPKALRARGLRWRGILASNRALDEEAERSLQDALQLYRDIEDESGVAATLIGLGIVEVEKGSHEKAYDYFEQGLDSNRRLGNLRGCAVALMYLGNISFVRGDHDQAEQHWQETLDIGIEIEDKATIPSALGSLGYVAEVKGDIKKAKQLYLDSLNGYRTIGHQMGVAICTSSLAFFLHLQDQSEKAVELLSAAAKTVEKTGTWLAENKLMYEHYVAKLQGMMDEDRFQQLWASGQAIPFEQAVEDVLSLTDI